MLAGDVKKVLILSSSIGSGHDAMGRAIIGELHALHPEVEVQMVDGLDLVKDGLATRMRQRYEKSVNVLHGAGFKLGYDITNTRLGAAFVRSGNAAAMEGKLASAVNAYAPDVVVSTYPFVGQVVARASRDGLLDASVHPLTTLIDADPHRSWFARGNDSHVTMFAGDAARVASVHPLQGAEHLRVVRPPVDPAKFQGFDRASARASFGLPNDRPVVLVSGGSLGLGMDTHFVQKLVDANPDVTYAILAGSNDKLFQDVGATFTATQAVAIPFTKQMPMLLATSDAAITNSGGMTTIEAFAAGTPVILHNVVPGHGVDSARALDADGIATYARNADDLRAALSSVGQPDGRLAKRARAATDTLFASGNPRISDVIVGAGLIPHVHAGAG